MIDDVRAVMGTAEGRLKHKCHNLLVKMRHCPAADYVIQSEYKEVMAGDGRKWAGKTSIERLKQHINKYGTP